MGTNHVSICLPGHFEAFRLFRLFYFRFSEKKNNNNATKWLFLYNKSKKNVFITFFADVRCSDNLERRRFRIMMNIDHIIWKNMRIFFVKSSNSAIKVLCRYFLDSCISKWNFISLEPASSFFSSRFPKVRITWMYVTGDYAHLHRWSPWKGETDTSSCRRCHTHRITCGRPNELRKMYEGERSYTTSHAYWTSSQPAARYTARRRDRKKTKKHRRLAIRLFKQSPPDNDGLLVFFTHD